VRYLNLYLFVLFLLVLRLYMAAFTGLAPDEGYYWYWSRYLDLAYFDHPPMVAWLIGATAFAQGEGAEIFVRLGGFLLALASLPFILLAARTLFPATRHIGRDLVLLLGSSLFLAAASVVITPDTPLLFFWSAAFYVSTLIVQGHNPRWWYLLGVLVGLGLLSKYTMILFAAALFLFLLLSREHRFWFGRKEPYLALMIAGVVFLPVILWNWQHDFISIRYQFAHGFSPREVNPFLKLLEYLGGQAALLTPLLFVALILYSVRALKAKGRLPTPYLLLLTFTWVPLLFFGASSLMGKTAEANWPACSYIAGFIFLAAFFHRDTRPVRRERIFFHGSLALAFALSLLVHVHFLYPILPLAPKTDPLHQFHGGKDLGRQMGQIIAANPHQEGYFILADRGTSLGQALFYAPVGLAGFDPFIPPRYLFLRDLTGLKGKNALVLLHQANPDRIDRFRPFFHELDHIGSFTPIYREEAMTHLRLEIFLGRNYVSDRPKWLTP
jgi:4-amino-4-deoxy-L-arabinose transferase-like glycosyltransferase